MYISACPRRPTARARPSGSTRIHNRAARPSAPEDCATDRNPIRLALRGCADAGAAISGSWPCTVRQGVRTSAPLGRGPAPGAPPPPGKDAGGQPPGACRGSPRAMTARHPSAKWYAAGPGPFAARSFFAGPRPAGRVSAGRPPRHASARPPAPSAAASGGLAVVTHSGGGAGSPPGPGGRAAPGRVRLFGGPPSAPPSLLALVGAAPPRAPGCAAPGPGAPGGGRLRLPWAALPPGAAGLMLARFTAASQSSKVDPGGYGWEGQIEPISSGT